MKKIIFLILICFSIAYAETNIYSSVEVSKHIGEVATVKGVLSEVYQSNNGNVFLNIDGSYPNQKFTGVIFYEDSHKFDMHKIKSKVGRAIIIKGFVKKYKGNPEIIIKNINQIVNYK